MPICALLASAGYSRMMVALGSSTRGASLPLAVPGPGRGFVGVLAHFPFPFVPMAPIPVHSLPMVPKGFTDMPLRSRELSVLPPRLKAWRRDATFVYILAPPLLLRQLCTTPTAAVRPALSRAPQPPSSRPTLLCCGRLAASASGSGRVTHSSASAGGVLLPLHGPGRLVLATRAPL
jgi:hypothetical protein